MSDSVPVTTKRVIKRKPQKRPKRDYFVQRYAIHHNATLAAIEAGYSPKNAAQTGSRLANDKELQTRINAYGQLGLDTLAVIATTSRNDIAREKASEYLIDRAYGKAKNNDGDKDKTRPIVIAFNRYGNDGTLLSGEARAILPDATDSGGQSLVTAQGE